MSCGTKDLSCPALNIDAPFDRHGERVRPEWIDYDGHLNVAYYVLAFDHATDAFLDSLGLDEANRERPGQSTFAVESHVTYQREVRRGDLLRFTTQMLGFDHNRIHIFHRVHHAQEGFLAATSEWLTLHVDLRTRRVAPMPDLILAELEEVMTAHRALAAPAEAGRVIRPPAPRPSRLSR